MNQVAPALTSFIDRSLALTPSGDYSIEFDAEWRSDCELQREGDKMRWKPSQQQSALNFSGLANAVEAEIHPDIQAFYGSFWSGGLFSKSSEGPVNLIQLWNPEDFDRLIENLIGHLFVQRRAKLPFTVFFATTDHDSELFLSIDNATGKIFLEEPGQAPQREVETDLATFLKRLDPVLTEAAMYE